MASGTLTRALPGRYYVPMCNRYRLSPDAELQGEFSITAVHDDLGDYIPGDVFPDQDALVIRHTDAGRQLTRMRWGFPPPPNAKPARPVTNARNMSSSWWLPWLRNPAHRCLVPASAFAEPHPQRKDSRGYTDNEWFRITDRDVFALAGVWRPWTGERRVRAGVKEHREWHTFAFATCPPNSLVQPIHEKAMPVLVDPADYETWLTAPWEDASRLVCPYPAQLMSIVQAIPAEPALELF